ncbi:MAG TPA: hypothetical protein VGD14_13740 [bacterium]
MKALIFIPATFALLINLSFAQQEKSDQSRVSQISVPSMTITDDRLIKLLMDEFFIPETLVTRMELFDVGKNGFGPKDLVRTYPSDEIYFLDFVSQNAQQIMNDWKFQANFQIIAQNGDPDVISNSSENKPAYNIFLSLLRSLVRNYKDYPIKLKLERDSSTVTFELWDYNENELKFDPKALPGTPDRLAKQAITFVDSTYYDCIFIYKTIADTVYIYQPTSNTVSK